MNLQGHATLIDMFEESIMPFKAKSIAISWEMMFTRSLFQTPDMLSTAYFERSVGIGRPWRPSLHIGLRPL
jgi:hypothetical protein